MGCLTWMRWWRSACGGGRGRGRGEREREVPPVWNREQGRESVRENLGSGLYMESLMGFLGRAILGSGFYEVSVSKNLF